MAIVRPFRALRPLPQFAASVASVPYDVVDTAEARALANGNPLSFLRVVRSEIELDDATDPYSDQVYALARGNLRRMAQSENFVTEAEPSLYLYRLKMGAHEQTGFFGCVSVDEYDTGLIKVHEKTRQDKENDRARHIIAVGAHAEPVFLAYKEVSALTKLMNEESRSAPLFNFTAADGITHTIWKMGRAYEACLLFKDVPALYIADGHHRAKSASRTREELKRTRSGFSGAEEFNFFPAVIFPHSQLQIMPYNRLLKELPLPLEGLLDALRLNFEINPTNLRAPVKKGDYAMYVDSKWLMLSPKHRPNSGSAIESLDVSMLQEQILAPIFKIMDPRTDKRIEFVGGIRGPAELERAVNSGRAQAAFSLYPVSMDELFSVADQGLALPPKSTWFEPKLRSGLLVHLMD